MSWSLPLNADVGGARMTRVLVTRASDDTEALVGALEQAGLEVCACPLVRIEAVAGDMCEASDFDWVVFTSRAGVRFGLPRLRGPLPQVAAVGPGTAAALREEAIDVALVPPVYSQRGLVSALGESAGTILFPGAQEAAHELVRLLGARHLVVYRTIELSLERVPDADLAVLASASAARALARHRRDIPCVTIGPSASAEAERCGLVIAREAGSSDLDGLVAAVTLAGSARP